MDIFAKNIYAMKDNTYNHLKRIIKDPNFVVVSGDRELCIITMSKIGYQNKLHQMIKDT